MNNMFLLIFLGAMMERQIGHLAYAIIYILSGIGGGMLSLFYKAITNERAASVGASGAVFGLIGVMLALVLLQRHKIPDVTPTRILIVIAFSLYVGMRSQNVDNAGHIGGILTGFFAGVLLCLIHRTQRLKKSR
jgi:rhomboid protease GluP